VIRKNNLNTDTRNVLPFPNITSREVNNLNHIIPKVVCYICFIQIGWLSSRQEFQLEIFGPYITRLPIEMKPNYKNEL